MKALYKCSPFFQQRVIPLSYLLTCYIHLVLSVNFGVNPWLFLNITVLEQILNQTIPWIKVE